MNNDPDSIGNDTKFCSINVSFTGSNPLFKNGAGERHISNVAPGYAVGFTVTGSVREGAIGKVETGAIGGRTAEQCPNNDCTKRSVTVNITYKSGKRISFSGFASIADGNYVWTGDAARAAVVGWDYAWVLTEDFNTLVRSAMEAAWLYELFGNRMDSRSNFAEPQNPKPEQIATTRAARFLGNTNCSNFITELISIAADFSQRGFPTFITHDFAPKTNLNGSPEPSYGADYALNLYQTALHSGRVTASGNSVRSGDLITYGTTSEYNIISWNRDFYSLGLDDQEFLSNVVYGRIIRRRFSEPPVVVRL
jgi:hypothetical protein